jgi:propanol-preferring alcohol dehydrogenase
VDGDLAACYMYSSITAYSAIHRIEDVIADGLYMILGLGGVGMMAVQAALALFATQPIVADIDDKKLDAARELGIQHAYNLTDPEAFKKIRKDTQGGLAGLADFAGSEKTVNPSVNLMRQRGKMVIVDRLFLLSGLRSLAGDLSQSF